MEKLSAAEKSSHVKKIRGILEAGEITQEQGLEGIRHCSILINDDFYSLPMDMGLEELSRLFKAAVGKPPGAFKTASIIPLTGSKPGQTAHEVGFLRGVSISLDDDWEILSISVDPSRFRRIAEILKYAGIIKGGPTDMSINHDAYWDEEQG